MSNLLEDLVDRLHSLTTFMNEIPDYFEELAYIKALDYRFRDIRLGKPVLSEDEYQRRAVDVIEQYYVRKHNYTQNWIE